MYFGTRVQRFHRKVVSTMAAPLLHIAASRGYINEVRHLLHMVTCDLNAVDDEGRTAIMEAFDKRHYDVAMLLIDAGCDVNTVDCHGNSALSEAVQEGDMMALKLLLPTDLNLDVQDSGGRTPLHLAMLKGTTSAAKILVDVGCQLDMQDDNGFTPVFLAAWDPYNRQLFAILQTLLEAGADPDICDVTNKPPITMAWTKWRSLLCLVQNGCRVENIYMNSYSLVMVASFEQDLRKLELLRAAGARVDSGSLQTDVIKGHRSVSRSISVSVGIFQPVNMDALQKRRCGFRSISGKVCGTELPNHLTFCPKCGGHAGSEGCKGCQRWLHPRGKYCGNCGLVTVVLNDAKTRAAQKQADDMVTPADQQKVTLTAGSSKCDVTSGGNVNLSSAGLQLNKELAEKAASKAQNRVRVSFAESTSGEKESVAARATQSEDSQSHAPLSHRHAFRRPSGPLISPPATSEKPEVSSPTAKTPKLI